MTQEIPEFWEQAFSQRHEMWWWTPADSAKRALELFEKNVLHTILIPGFGYGRNAEVFTKNGYKVTGIEISETAVELGKKHFGDSIKIHHGSVSSMPFDTELYDGVFSYALLHLLSEDARKKCIRDCYNQLSPGGYMVFVSIAKSDFRYGQGKEVKTDTFEMPYGVTLFFYDTESIDIDFAEYGLVESIEISEGEKDMSNAQQQRFWYIVCRKDAKLVDELAKGKKMEKVLRS